MKYFFCAWFLCALLAHQLQSADRSGFAESSDSVRLYYDVRGQGQPLVVIPGGPGDSHAYLRPYFEKFEHDLTIIYFDGRGRGRSSRLADRSRYSLRQDVEDLERLRQHLGYDSMHVFGHSYGGLVAQSYALQYPDHVRSLILCNTFHSADGWQDNIDHCNDHIEESYPEVWEQLAIIGLRGHSNTKVWRDLYDPCIQTLYWYNPAKRTQYRSEVARWETADDAFSEDVYYAIIGPDPDVEVGGSLKGLDLRGELPSMRVRTMVIGGRADRIATVEQARQIHRLIPLSDFEIFEKSGHYPFVEQRKLFRRTLLNFVLPHSKRGQP